MTKKKQTKAKRQSKGEKKKKGRRGISNKKVDKQLEVGVKVGILRTIASSIYPSTARKIREAVANAMDNDASWVVILADPAARTLCLFDNGRGITDTQFEDIFKSLGYGMLKHEEGALSYFGLGLMSIFRLGERVKMYTRASGKRGMQVLEIETIPVFAEENENEPIDFLREYVHLRSTDELGRAASAAPILDEYLEKLFDGVPGSFTEIVIENVNEEDMVKITADEFTKELGKLLPVRAEVDEPFLRKFRDRGTAKVLRSILSNPEYCPTIDVYFGIAGEQDIVQLWKYFPEFKRELTFGEAEVEAGVDEEGGFAYYIVHTTEDLERYDKEGSETGFWVRNRNFLVRSADFFEKAGSRKKYVNEPLKNWMFGEIFHGDMNAFLSVARDDYLWETTEFVRFRDRVVGLVQHLNQELRECWRRKKGIIGSIIEPLVELGKPSGAIGRTEDMLRKMQEAEEDEVEFRRKTLAKLASRRTRAIEKEERRIDKLLKSGEGRIVLADDPDVLVEINPAVEDLEGQTAWEASSGRLTVSLSPRLFNPQEVVFLGRRFEIVFVAANDRAPGVSIDVNGGRIYVNPFNHDLKLYNISFLDVYIAVELADAVARNKEELKHYLLRLLGRKAVSVGKYFTPLQDELMRRRRAR